MKMIDLQNKATILEKKSRYFHSFSKLRNELYNSPGMAYSIEKLASKVNLSKSYFQLIYKKLFGCSVISDLIHARLDYAKYLLKNSPFSVTTIAKKCGYENNTHFMRQFKKFVGVTPSQYKDR
ncbi:Arabinose operon regulatory protein [compost metagenome]